MREAWGEGLLFASLGWSIFAIGGTLPWSVVGLLGFVALSTLVNASLGRFRVDAGVVVLFALAGYTALQCAPLPLSWLAILDGSHAETWGRVMRLLDVTTPARLSLEPDTTRFEAVRLVCYGLTWGLVASRAKIDGPLTVARWVAWLCAAVAVVTLFHRVLGVQQVYGGYAPHFSGSRWVGPLLNPNNLGGSCNLGVFCALACSSRRGGRGNPVYFVIAVGLACLTVLTGSRGAVIALGGGGLLFLGAWLRARQRLPEMQHWGLAYGVVSLLTLVALTLDRPVIEELSGRSVEKVNLLRWGVSVVRTHPWWGVGMGAFDAEVATVSGQGGNVAFPYVECFPLDVMTAWGVPVGASVIAALGFGLWRIGGGLRTHAMRLGLCVVLLQNLMDLGMQVPGLMLPWVSVFAACWGGATRRTWSVREGAIGQGWVGRGWVGRGWVGQASAAGAVVLGALLASPVVEPVGVLRQELAKQVTTANGESSLEHALLRHPGDAYLLRMRAALGVRDQQPDALAWVNAALLRAPSDARTHLLLAHALLSRGRVSQALPSLRAAAMDRTLHPEIVHLLGVWAPTRVVDAAPDGPFGAALLRLAAGNKPLDGRLALLERAEQLAPNDPNTSVELTQTRLRLLEAKAESCEVNSACQRELSAAVTRAGALGATPAQLRVLEALLSAVSGQVQAGFDTLMAGCERSPRGRACLQVLVDLGARLGKEPYEQSVRIFLDSVCGGQTVCTHERLGMAAQLVRQGSVAQAHEIYVQETSATSIPEAFIQAARTSAQLGRPREALHWLDKAEQQHRADPAVIARLTVIRSQIATALQGVPPR